MESKVGYVWSLRRTWICMESKENLGIYGV